MEETKRCTKCFEEKPIVEFYRNRSKLDGHEARCKACIKLWRKSDYAKAYNKEYNKKWIKIPEHASYRRKYKNNWVKTLKGKACRARVYHKRFTTMKTLRCDLTSEQWEEIKLNQNYMCNICGEVKPLHRDHIIPVSKGGEFTKNNIQGLCASCNAKKSNKII